MMWASMSRALSQRASQKPSRPASKATAMRSMLCPDFFASSRQRMSSFSKVLSSTSSFFNGWRSMPGTIPATSQLERLISITAISVRSGLRGVRDRLRSFNFCMGGTPSVHINVDGCNILADVRPIASSLKAFGRRPRCKPHRCDRPASETLNRSGHGGSAERFQLKTLNVGARQGGIASPRGIDADHVDFVRHVAVRVFPHVHHHRGDRLAYPADPEKCERALLAPLNVLFSCHRRQHQGHEQVRVPACHWPSPWPWPKRLILMNFVYGVCELFHTWFRAANFAKESRHSAKRRPRWVKLRNTQHEQMSSAL